MSSSLRVAAALMVMVLATDPIARADELLHLGRFATPNEISGWDIDVRPDGRGLPPGQGDATTGQWAYAQWCSGCHGEHGSGGSGPALAGGVGSLATLHPIKTVGSYWPYSTTLFDYVRRTMPLYAPQSLKADELYSITAYVLVLNGLMPPEMILDATTLPRVSMPNRYGFVSGDGSMMGICGDQSPAPSGP
jgi:cytochrome c553